MRTGLIIFARYDSRRLPGKAVRPLAGRALLARVIDRARRVPGAPPVTVATSDRAVDDPVAALAEREGAALYRGAAEDVAARALAAAESGKLDAFARISGDSPFFDHVLLAEMIAERAEAGLDLATNVMPRSFPPGASCEVIALAAMRRLVVAAHEPDEREHVTLYFYRHPEQFRIRNWRAPDGCYDRLRLAVDTADDLARADRIAREWGPGLAEAPFDEIVALARSSAPATPVEASN